MRESAKQRSEHEIEGGSPGSSRTEDENPEDEVIHMVVPKIIKVWRHNIEAEN